MFWQVLSWHVGKFCRGMFWQVLADKAGTLSRLMLSSALEQALQALQLYRIAKSPLAVSPLVKNSDFENLTEAHDSSDEMKRSYHKPSTPSERDLGACSK